MKEFTCILLLFTYSCLAQSTDPVGLILDFSESAIAKYPILGEVPFPELNGKDLQIAEDALKLAGKLTKSCECDKALEEFGIPSLDELLKLKLNLNVFNGRQSTVGLPAWDEKGRRETVASRFVKHRNRIAASVVPETFTGFGKVIFLNEYFFNPKYDAMTAKQQRALILIHESVHQFGRKSDEHFGGSGRLTDIIARKCLPALDSIKMLGKLSF